MYASIAKPHQQQAPILTPQEREAFLDACAKKAAAYTTAEFSGPRRNTVLRDTLLSALQSPEIEELLKNGRCFPQVFPQALCRACDSDIALRNSKTLPDKDGNRRFDFLIDQTNGSTALSLRPVIKKAIQDFATECLVEFWPREIPGIATQTIGRF